MGLVATEEVVLLIVATHEGDLLIAESLSRILHFNAKQN
jgi:hypothetical protein